MTEIEWRKILEDDLALTRKMLDDYEAELKKMPGEKAYVYLRPIRDILYDALMETLQDKNKRIDEGDNILNKI